MEALAHPCRTSAHDLHTNIRVEQVHQKTLRTGIFGWFLPSFMKEGSRSSSIRRNQASTSVVTGSSRTPVPTRRTLTSSPGNRKSFGSLTAWLLPLRKSLAVELMLV